ncbi:DUF397 domain-containing protein [Kitasatospora cheerisanensis]|uniref:DUF397 domain-containing protein n=1 Tax=Kitasatospora cheerisanensis KCTC 2395 TaxID=1348663 RepID=A0A066YKL3_9ACTN|nr:DUF397 domain-containing protein [Kitasatospora cheerisanensis]KDN81667.1 hypothetical protein KCH_63870 [Kitasatospora cheerisanensis KCTC 2395]
MTTHIAATELVGAGWKKSSYSGGGNNCVEHADLTGTAFDAIAIRDSKDPAGPALLVSREAFGRLVAFAASFDV